MFVCVTVDKKEKQDHKDPEKELKDKVVLMDEQVSLLKASSGKMDEASRKAFEKQLNHYIKEIDRCIAMLSQ